jgi:hypothetical protein
MNGQPEADVVEAVFNCQGRVSVSLQDQVREEYARLIKEGMLDSASANGFTVELGDGTRRVIVDGGLQARDYEYLAPLLNDLDKAILAKGVLENLLRPCSWRDFDIGWRRLLDKVPNVPEEDWLPSFVEKHGFDAIAAAMKQAIENFHRANPGAFMEKPRWDSMWLVWRGHKWRFRNQAKGPVRDSLNALESRGWPLSVELSHLDPDQVREAARSLNAKTWKKIRCIHWRSSGRILSWSTL